MYSISGDCFGDVILETLGRNLRCFKGDRNTKKKYNQICTGRHFRSQTPPPPLSCAAVYPDHGSELDMALCHRMVLILGKGGAESLSRVRSRDPRDPARDPEILEIPGIQLLNQFLLYQ